VHLTGLAGAEAGAPPSSPTKLRIVASHPNNKKIAMTMTEEDEGGTSVTMVVADNNGGRGDRHPNCHRWRFGVVLSSHALPPSCNDGGSRGA
jgi:hypothetical protein